MTIHHQVAAEAVTSPRPPATDRTYSDFLHLETLFTATQEVPSHPDGRLFVIAHQAFELWFDLLVNELGAARDDLLADRIRPAWDRLRRIVAVDRLLVYQLETLTTISPDGFRTLRPHLGTASGLQSVRFKEIEYLSGLRPPRHCGPRGVGASDAERLRRRLAEPSLAEAFDGALRRQNVADPSALYQGGWQELRDVADALLDHDETWALWRARHAQVVERMIGRRSGTGGSSGVEYLESRRDERFFPALWQARTHL